MLIWSGIHPVSNKLVVMGFDEPCAHGEVASFNALLSNATGWTSCLSQESGNFSLVSEPEEWYWLSSRRRGAVIHNSDVYYRITCSVPHGIGTNNSIMVEKQCLASGAITMTAQSQERCNNSRWACFSYPPPRISMLSPANGSTAGNYWVEIIGQDFGYDDYLSMDRQTVVVLLGGAAVQVLWSASNNTVITFIAPAGEGRDLPVEVIVGGQSSTVDCTMPAMFSYDAPVIASAAMIRSIDTRRLQSADDLLAGGELLEIQGNNFGIYPVFSLNGQVLQLLSHDHSTAVVVVPEGQGQTNQLAVSVAKQIATAPFLLSYRPPVIAHMTLLSCGQLGGKVEGCLITMQGNGFGSADRANEISVSIGSFPVASKDITMVNSSALQFYAPAGQGSNLSVIVTVSNISSMPASLTFSFISPEIFSIQLDMSNRTVDGRAVLLISGRALGAGPADVRIIYEDNSTAFYEQICDVVYRDYHRIYCALYPQTGEDVAVEVVMSQGTLSGRFSFVTPVLSSILQSRQGDANGGEDLTVYGDGFGTFPGTLELLDHSSDEGLCREQAWSLSSAIGKPVLKCITKSKPVGTYSIYATIGGQMSSAYSNYSVSCKSGYFGGVGQYCSRCQADSNGLSCPKDNMTLPDATEGWFVYSFCDSSTKSNQTLKSTCAAAFPCQPAGSCIGENACSYPYSGEGCFSCSAGYFRINSQCKPCLISYCAVGLLVLLVSAFCAKCYTLSASKRAELAARVILVVDFMQTIGLLSNVNNLHAAVPQGFLNVFAVSFLHWELWNNPCWLGSTLNYTEAFEVTANMAAVGLLAILLCDGIYSCYRAAVVPRVQRNAEDLIMATGLTKKQRFFADVSDHIRRHHTAYGIYLLVAYAMICSLAWSSFNCLPTSLSDGRSYLPYIGNSFDSVCYESDHEQHALVPYSIALLVIVGLGVPCLLGGFRWKSLCCFSLRTCLQHCWSAGRWSNYHDDSDNGSVHGTECSDEGSPKRGAKVEPFRRPLTMADRGKSLTYEDIFYSSNNKRRGVAQSQWLAKAREKSSTHNAVSFAQQDSLLSFAHPHCRWFVAWMLLKKCTVGALTVSSGDASGLALFAIACLLAIDTLLLAKIRPLDASQFAIELTAISSKAPQALQKAAGLDINSLCSAIAVAQVVMISLLLVLSSTSMMPAALSSLLTAALVILLLVCFAALLMRVIMITNTVPVLRKQRTIDSEMEAAQIAPSPSAPPMPMPMPLEDTVRFPAEGIPTATAVRMRSIQLAKSQGHGQGAQDDERLRRVLQSTLPASESPNKRSGLAARTVVVRPNPLVEANRKLRAMQAEIRASAPEEVAVAMEEKEIMSAEGAAVLAVMRARRPRPSVDTTEEVRTPPPRPSGPSPKGRQQRSLFAEDSPKQPQVPSRYVSQQHRPSAAKAFLSLLDTARRTPRKLNDVDGTSSNSSNHGEAPAPAAPAPVPAVMRGFVAGRHVSQQLRRPAAPPPLPAATSSAYSHAPPSPGSGLSELAASSVVGLRALRRVERQSLRPNRGPVQYDPNMALFVNKPPPPRGHRPSADP